MYQRTNLLVGVGARCGKRQLIKTSIIVSFNIYLCEFWGIFQLWNWQFFHPRHESPLSVPVRHRGAGPWAWPSKLQGSQDEEVNLYFIFHTRRVLSEDVSYQFYQSNKMVVIYYQCALNPIKLVVDLTKKHILTITSLQAPRCTSWKANKLKSSIAKKLTTWQIYKLQTNRWQEDRMTRW